MPYILSYADDTVIFSVENNWEEAEIKMNSNLKIIGDWFIANKLTINTKKTSYINFGCTRNKLLNNINITINFETISRTDTIKYLGVIFDCRMRWVEHI